MPVSPCVSYRLCSIRREKKTEDGRDFLLINPEGYIPTLELEDGTILTENQVVLHYIAERSGKLLPMDGIARWRTLEALAFMRRAPAKSLQRPSPSSPTRWATRHF
jgi:glutathione S-transferase